MNKPKPPNDLYYVYGALILLCVLSFLFYFLIQDDNWKPILGNIATDSIFILLAVLFIDRRIEQAKQKEYLLLAQYLMKSNFSFVNIILSQLATSSTPVPNMILSENETIERLFQDPNDIEGFEKIVQARKKLFLNIVSFIQPLLTFTSINEEDRKRALLILNPLLQQIYLREITIMRDKIRTDQISSIFPATGLMFLKIQDKLTHIISIGNFLKSRIKNANEYFKAGETQDQFFVFTCLPNDISISSGYLFVIYKKLTEINELFINCDNSTRSKLLDAIKSNE